MSALSSTPHQSSPFLSAHRCATVSLLRVTCLFYNDNDQTKAVPIHSFFSHENNEQLLMFFLCGRSWLIVILFFLLLTGEVVFSSWLATCCISLVSFHDSRCFYFCCFLRRRWSARGATLRHCCVLCDVLLTSLAGEWRQAWSGLHRKALVSGWVSEWITTSHGSKQKAPITTRC